MNISLKASIIKNYKLFLLLISIFIFIPYLTIRHINILLKKNFSIIISLPPYLSNHGKHDILLYFQNPKVNKLFSFLKPEIDICQYSSQKSSIRPIFTSLKLLNNNKLDGIYKFEIPDVSLLYNKITVWKIKLKILFSEIILAQFKINLKPDIKIFSFPDFFILSKNYFYLNLLPIDVATSDLIKEFSIRTKINVDSLFYYMNNIVVSNQNGFAKIKIDVDNFIKNKKIQVEISSTISNLYIEFVNTFSNLNKSINWFIKSIIYELFKEDIYFRFQLDSVFSQNANYNNLQNISGKYNKSNKCLIINNIKSFKKILIESIKKINQVTNVEFWMVRKNIYSGKVSFSNSYQTLQNILKLINNLDFYSMPYLVVKFNISKNYLPKLNNNKKKNIVTSYYIVFTNLNYLYKKVLLSNSGTLINNTIVNKHKLIEYLNYIYYIDSNRIYSNKVIINNIRPKIITHIFLYWSVIFSLFITICLLIINYVNFSSDYFTSNSESTECGKLFINKLKIITFALFYFSNVSLVFASNLEFKFILISILFSTLFMVVLYLISCKLFFNHYHNNLIYQHSLYVFFLISYNVLLYLTYIFDNTLLENVLIAVNKLIITLPIVALLLILFYKTQLLFSKWVLFYLSCIIMLIYLEFVLIEYSKKEASCNSKLNLNFYTENSIKNNVFGLENHFQNNSLIFIKFYPIVFIRYKFFTALPYKLLNNILELIDNSFKLLSNANSEIYLVLQSINIRNYSINSLVPVTNLNQFIDILISENQNRSESYAEKLSTEIIFRLIRYEKAHLDLLKENELQKIQSLHTELLRLIILDLKKSNKLSQTLLEKYYFIYDKLNRLIYIDPMVDVHVKPLFSTINKSRSEILYDLLSKFITNLSVDYKFNVYELFDYINEDGEIILKGPVYRRFFKLKDNLVIWIKETNQYSLEEIVINRTRPLFLVINF